MNKEDLKKNHNKKKLKGKTIMQENIVAIYNVL